MTFHHRPRNHPQSPRIHTHGNSIVHPPEPSSWNQPFCLGLGCIYVGTILYQTSFSGMYRTAGRGREESNQSAVCSPHCSIPRAILRTVHSPRTFLSSNRSHSPTTLACHPSAFASPRPLWLLESASVAFMSGLVSHYRIAFCFGIFWKHEVIRCLCRFACPAMLSVYGVRSAIQTVPHIPRVWTFTCDKFRAYSTSTLYEQCGFSHDKLHHRGGIQKQMFVRIYFPA